MNRLTLTSSTPGQRIWATVVALGMLAILLCAGGLLTVQFPEYAGAWLGGAVIAVLILFLGWLVLRTYRAAAWLENTDLVVRGAFSTTRVDLASAPVRISTQDRHRGSALAGSAYTGRAGRMPVLRVRRPNGRWLTLALRAPDGGLMGRDLLIALAEAVAAGRRTEPEQGHARVAADVLRELATNPLSHLL